MSTTIQPNTTKYTCKHVLIDAWGIPEHICTDLDYLKKILYTAAEEAKATVISKGFHHFGTGLGVTGILLLAESHISIHTWPELNHAVLDILMCGSCDPEHSIETLIKGLGCSRYTLNVLVRGMYK